MISGYRAATFPFTHDESLSFAIFSWDPGWAGDANNHVLNTWLMRVGGRLFQNADWSLRLPNLLAHALYLLAGLALLRRVTPTLIVIAGFVFLNLNLFLLDFFFLARGYGLAVGLVAGSVVCVIEASDSKSHGRSPWKWGAGGITVAGLAVLANYSALPFFLTLLGTAGWLLLTDETGRKAVARWKRLALAIAVPVSVFLIPVGLDLRALQRGGHLYFGGETGFVQDTVKSLTVASSYGAATIQEATMVVVVIVALALGIAAVAAWSWFAKRGESALNLATLLLFGTVFAVMLSHVVLGALLPIERAALVFVPLFALALTFALSTLAREGSLWIRRSSLAAAAVLAGVLAGVFVGRLNLRTCFNWGYDAHNKEVLRLIDQDRRRLDIREPVLLANSWLFEASFRFYKERDRLDWLGPVLAGKWHARADHYAYVFLRDLDELPAERTVLASFDDTGTTLVRLRR